MRGKTHETWSERRGESKHLSQHSSRLSTLLFRFSLRRLPWIDWNLVTRLLLIPFFTFADIDFHPIITDGVVELGFELVKLLGFFYALLLKFVRLDQEVLMSLCVRVV